MSRIKVTLKKSLNGTRAEQKRTASCLGSEKNQPGPELLRDSLALRGQIKKIRHLLSWEEQ